MKDYDIDEPFKLALTPRKPKTDWVTIFVNVGLWGMAVLLTLPYLLK